MHSISKSEMETIFNSTHDGMIAVNADGIVTLFNKAAERITGMNVKDMMGIPAVDCIPNTRLHIVLDAGHLPLMAQEITGSIPVASGPVQPLKNVVDEAEKIAIEGALLETEGSRTKAASLLNISMRSLFYKIEKHSIK